MRTFGRTGREGLPVPVEGGQEDRTGDGGLRGPV